MDFNDLFQAAGYAAVAYLVFNVLISFGSGRPLVEWINPGRRFLPPLTVALLILAGGLLHKASLRYQQDHLDLLRVMISKDQAKPEVLGAVAITLFALSVLPVFVWCWLFLPRDPRTFSPNPKNLIEEYTRALKHYVRWSGGLDYAVLCEVSGERVDVLATGAAARDILRGLNRLPGVHAAPDAGTGRALVEEQQKLWAALARELFLKWPEFSRTLVPVRQGGTVAVCFDLRYGAVFAEMVEAGADLAGGPTPIALFLFGVTLNQHEVNNQTAGRHFSMLAQAVRHIRSGVVKN
ncbi:hypothetical protein [Fimbriiglobus ruber]|uniref:Uncharacterized protein n=1 Tax=Fimbriiglobus ruber TaxID=1908690 RepID=A0A225DGY0_9BACT|nr:hypothetical protein [Fimbriiglobus ruber]OWK36636.1 hypothetical protein FRUB_09199 [Fimbriiglobus ruber]